MVVRLGRAMPLEMRSFMQTSKLTRFSSTASNPPEKYLFCPIRLPLSVILLSI